MSEDTCNCGCNAPAIVEKADSCGCGCEGGTQDEKPEEHVTY